MSDRAAPQCRIIRTRALAASVAGGAVAAAGFAGALLLPDQALAGWIGRLWIAALGAAAGGLAWWLARSRRAAVPAGDPTPGSRRRAAEASTGRQVERLLSQLPDAVVAVDTNGAIRIANASAARLLGVRPEHVGRRYAEVLTAPSLQRLLAPIVAGNLERGAADLADVVPDAVIHVRVSRVQEEGDGWLALLCAADATRLRQLEQLRREFVANVSHELRTPITAIKGFVETMLDQRLYRGSDGKRFLRITRAQAERLHALVEDLLSLSRIEQGEHDGIDATAEPLAPIVMRAIDSCRSRAAKRSVRIDTDGLDGLRVRANAPLLERALVNLLDNALLYGREGGAVHVSARNDDGVRIEVTDDGPGIAAEHLDRLFERFYRVERDSSTPGSGLGLAIVKHIVQAHGGRVGVESELRTGTTFTLRFPA